MDKDPDAETTVKANRKNEAPAEPEPGESSSEETSPGGSASKHGSSLLGGLVRFVAALAGVSLDLVMLGLTGASAFVAVTLTELPETDVLKDVRLKEPLRVYSADGALMAEFGVQRRTPVSIDEIPQMLTYAFLAIEDSRFFEHEGIDVTGIARAAVSYARTRERSQGGSTITMQLARNFFLTREKTFRRKFAELLLALHIERTLTKEEILELYLNKIFFGHRAYGIAAAADVYYGKKLADLEIAEMAMLAGIPKAPSANNPITNPGRAHVRRNLVLRRMRDLGYIRDDEFQTASAVTDPSRPHEKEVDLKAGYAAELVRQEMFERYGEDAYSGGYRVTTSFLSNLQRAAQDALRESLRAYDRRHGYHGAEARHDIESADNETLDRLLAAVRVMPELRAGIVAEAGSKEAQVYIGDGERVTLGLKQVKWAREFKSEKWRGPAPRKVTDVLAPGDLVRLIQDGEGRWELSQIPSVAGALVSLSPADGAIRAMVGGYYFDDSKFNRAVDARRQPGSSFKPFIYSAALNKGYTPVSRVRDEPFSRAGWSPQNFDKKYKGRIPMRKALYLSRNLAAVNTLNRVGLDETRDYIQRFGFELKDTSLGLSMALGTAEISPLQMAGAYALFANGGYQVTPYFISRIENTVGELIFEAKAARACSDCWAIYDDSHKNNELDTQIQSKLAQRVLDPRVAYQMTSMLKDVIKRGTGRRALKLKRKDIAGKTGTTNDVRDSWFCGFQKDYVTVAWMGFDEFHPLGRGETGGQAAIGMWIGFMGAALKDQPQAILDPPDGMVKKSDEWIREEYANALQGPKPVGGARRASSSGKKRRGGVKRRAPRVIDELF